MSDLKFFSLFQTTGSYEVFLKRGSTNKVKFWGDQFDRDMMDGLEMKDRRAVQAQNKHEILRIGWEERSRSECVFHMNEACWLHSNSGS